MRYSTIWSYTVYECTISPIVKCILYEVTCPFVYGIQHILNHNIRQNLTCLCLFSSDVLAEIDMYIPKWTGIRYAKVSGDWNPHHLYPWSARLIGYKMPIAHGMWTLGRVIAEMKSSCKKPIISVVK